MNVNFYWGDGRHKATVWEGGVRAPLIFAGYGVTVDGVCSVPVMAPDIYPTVNALMGVLPDPTVTVNGVSLTPLLTGSPFTRAATTGPGVQIYGPYIYTEMFSQNFDLAVYPSVWHLPTHTVYHRAATDGMYKVIKEYFKGLTCWTVTTRYLRIFDWVGAVPGSQIEEEEIPFQPTHQAIEAMMDSINPPPTSGPHSVCQ